MQKSGIYCFIFYFCTPFIIKICVLKGFIKRSQGKRNYNIKWRNIQIDRKIDIQKERYIERQKDIQIDLKGNYKYQVVFMHTFRYFLAFPANKKFISLIIFLYLIGRGQNFYFLQCISRFCMKCYNISKVFVVKLDLNLRKRRF